MNSPAIPWRIPESRIVPEEISAFFQKYPSLSQAMYQRGFTTANSLQLFLYPETYQPTNPLEFPGVKGAVTLLRQAINKQQTIGVWGDFDVDGQTATAILVDSLRKLGAKVVYHLPIRAKESHGITVPFLKEFLFSGVNLLLTCDTGITAHEAIAYALQQDITVIVTDHHTLEDELPDANAIVHPHLAPQEHPARPLCGAGAALMLAAALLDDLTFTAKAAELLDLAALGTIADLAILTGDNRYFVQRGLQRIRKHPLPLLEAIFELTETNLATINEEHISFQVAPRLNSLGRLSDANPAVEMLLSKNLAECRLFVNQIEAMNTKRKYVTEQVFQAARAQIESNQEILQQPVIIVSSPEWPGGIVGIVASRIAEFYNKPALVISTPQGESARGSARSIEGLDITACLKSVRELLLTHGGHPMAAGFSLHLENLEKFKLAMTKTVEQANLAAPPAQGIIIDAFITLPEISLNLVDTLEQLGPFGPGNPPLTFACRDLSIIKQTPLGRTGEHIQLILGDTSGNTMPAIRWQATTQEMPEGFFDLAFTLRKSEYKGLIEPQITWQHTRLSENSVLIQDILQPLEVIDFRTNFLAGKEWLEKQEPDSTFIFSEGLVQKVIPGSGRNELHTADILVLTSSPPDRLTLSNIVSTVSPRIIAFFGLKSSLDEPPELMKQLIGLIHYAQKHKYSCLPLAHILQATAQSEAVIETAIDWINNQGELTLQEETNGTFLVVDGGIYNREASQKVQNLLKELLIEAKAFRAYYSRVDLEILLAGINRKKKKE